jgi:hypothetical protein
VKRDQGKKTPFPKPAKSPTPQPAMKPPVDLATFQKQSSKAPRQYSSDAPTMAPPPSEQEISIGGAEIDPFEIEVDVDADGATQRVTVTNEVELETARLQSVVLSSLPPPREDRPPPAPEPKLSGNHFLNLANAQAPTVPPPRDYESAKMAAAAPVPPAPPAPAWSENEAATKTTDAKTGENRVYADPLVEMRERHSLGDFTGALEVAEKLLAEDPANETALACAEDCRTVLIKMYSARIGPLDRVPVVMVPRHQLRWLSIDHRAGFVLSHIDGTSSLEMILDVSGMAPLDALRILHELVQQKIISFR